jgi:hypothetical protein
MLYKFMLHISIKLKQKVKKKKRKHKTSHKSEESINPARMGSVMKPVNVGSELLSFAQCSVCGLDRELHRPVNHLKKQNHLQIHLRTTFCTT